MILDTVNRTLEIDLAGSVTANQLPVTVFYSECDEAAEQVTPAPERSLTNNTTAVTILSAPASNNQRVVDSINVYNADTVAATVTIQFNDNGTIAILKKKTLASGETLAWTRGSGWG